MGGITSNENQQLSQTRQSDVQKKSLQSARSKLYTDQNELQERSQFNSLIKTDVKLEEQVHHNEDLKNNNQMNQIRQPPRVGQDIQQVHAQLQLHIQQKIEIQQIEEFQQTQDDLYFQFQRQCVIGGHKRASILEYCLNKQCKESQRFICELCQKDGLHQKDMNFKQTDIIKQYQISDKIKQNYNSQVQIHNYCTKIVQEILKKCKAQVESLHQHVANLTTLINFNESRQSLLFLQSILKEQVQIGQIANDQLFKIVTEEPETYIFKQFHSIMDNFKLIQNDIEQLSKTSSEIPELQEKIWRILKDEKKEQQIPDPQQQDQDKLTDEILSQALLLVQQARFKQALEDLNKHLLENKNKKREGEIRITLGYTYYKEKDYPNSRIQYEEALKISNQCDLYNIYYYIGKCQLKQYEFDQTQIKFEDILKSFQQTLTLSPSFRKAYLQIAKMHLKVQNHELAVNYLMQGLELDKKNIKILSFLAKINLDLLQYNEALKYYDLCLDLNRNHLTSLLGKGLTLFKSNQYQKAIVVIDDIIKFNNQIPEAYLLKSDCFQRLNQDDQAIKILHEQSIRFKGDIRFKRKLELILIQNLQYNQFQ